MKQIYSENIVNNQRLEVTYEDWEQLYLCVKKIKFPAKNLESVGGTVYVP